jgi:hypothetical protein
MSESGQNLLDRFSRALPLLAMAFFLSSVIVSTGMGILTSSLDIRHEFWARLLCKMAHNPRLTHRSIELMALLILALAMAAFLFTPPKQRDKTVQLVVPSTLMGLGFIFYYAAFPNLLWGLSIPIACGP